ncbi:MAG TPA: metallophosphoesterase family protein [Ktedonosporobacter sp.]|nr:metallophosphoesterase family protein [Ktedonosporobacter sp.]
MRIALLSDIHGNPMALDAVLADIQAQGEVDAYWVLGDMAALGYDPAGAIERIAALPNARFVRGNTDRYTVSSDLPFTVEYVLEHPRLLPRTLNLVRDMGWTQGMVTAAGKLQWLKDLPLEQRLTLPDGTRLLGVHAAPGTDDGDGIHPKQSDDELRAILAGCEADLIFVGHTHVALDRTVDTIRVVNLGSVSLPFTPDLRASYVLLDANTSGYQLEMRRVEYDREAVLAKIRESGRPAGEFISQMIRGETLSRWLQP